MAAELKYCSKCGKALQEKEFYNTNNLEKHPDGKVPYCKSCFTMFVDCWDAETYIPLLEECDVPYIPDEWNKLLLSYSDHPEKISGKTIVGKYLAKMKLKQFRDYRFKDTDRIQNINNKKIEEAMKKSGYDAVEIAEQLEKNTISPPQKPIELIMEQNAAETPSGQVEDYFSRDNQHYENELIAGLTEEDKKYLLLKWGKTYSQSEWIKLEEFYQEMLQSYDVQGAGHEDTLKLVCKTSLKANQLLDIGDVDGAQKMLKMYDGLMKSGKFTAAQNKAESGEFIDAISELVEICEKHGFIERYYVETPKDKVDETIFDLKNYTNSLVTGEMNLGNLIENAIKEMSLQESKEEDEDEDEELTYDNLSELKDEDFDEFQEFIESQELEDIEEVKL